ncbi:META domain-containing protein [Parabacteroides sp. 52]|uniref:META domain-containing protein n=1 Tax=unclassified Parabacteroides TaxID=2649774 RepID=UPI0013D67383|nr:MULTISPECIES: META domain-containing protein [unclassified Parabacteroides]MDH6534118.1 heat shock protein HslJ [Parabacteroides sp. PM5-20]NDV54979.1 META domain-containing protein [Parabacteroides sp. 52]
MKKVLFYLMALPVCVWMMASCAEKKVDAKALAGKWNIVEVKGTVVEKKEKVPFMEFDMSENRLHGNAGCNIFNTAVKLDAQNPAAISFAPAIATMMACLDMELERTVMKSLEEVSAVKAGKTANEMVLVDKDGNTLFVLAK